MAATNRYFNISGVSFTPTGGSAVLFPKCKSANYDEGISIKKESGDGDGFFTVALCDFKDPSVTFEILDAFAGYLTAIAGVKGALTWTVNDAYNATGTGAKTYTMANAELESRGQNSVHRDYGKQSVKFGCISSDGSTHPVSVASAA